MYFERLNSHGKSTYYPTVASKNSETNNTAVYTGRHKEYISQNGSLKTFFRAANFDLYSYATSQ